ncbi:four helix bundle protein [Marinoscillum sp. MHG1-6]|uniref:four helix bundle protein n=1 Tax=Marinoscillum sp. MHG1-6 TaxID=2959627 RepID=UPI00215895CB|nr:four helix bundle protein [Marinoscillum sp. MHG1-6]
MREGSTKQEVGFKIEKLRIWQDSMDFAEMVFKASKDFPDNENFNLTSQIRRAVNSVGLNISEGSILQSNAEFRRFLGYSIRSLAEVVTCLHKAKRRDYMSGEEFNDFYLRAYNLMNMIIGFRNKLI